jgi:hypothetical protein
MEHIDDIDDELKCLLCKQPFQSPVSHTLCHYDFCQECIDIYLKKNRVCPGCEQTLDDQMEEENDSIPLLEIFSFVPISTRIVLNRLDRLLVQCLVCQEENISRSHFEDHEEICRKKIMKCQSVDMKCTWKGPREKLDKHLKKCPIQKIRPILDQFQRKINTIETKQNQMKRSMKKFEKQMAFILAFINEGIPMNKYCTKSSNQCRYKHLIHGKSSNVFTCRMCNILMDDNEISVHACNQGAICRLCFDEQYPVDETKTDSEYNDVDKAEFSPISTIHSP